MNNTHRKRQFGLPTRLVAFFTILTFLSSWIILPQKAHAQSALNLPAPGVMVMPTTSFIPAVMKGIKIFPDNPLRFDFIIDTGDSQLEEDSLERESSRLIKYFLASLTVPEDELWVNLSPYEKDRIIPDKFSMTEMGRDLLAQDYVLKQLTASLIYPKEELGNEFWERVYTKANELYGTSEVPVNTFNKVWVAPEKATIYESGDIAFIVESHLKVMLEGDYLALKENMDREEMGTDQLDADKTKELSDVSSEIIREVILPEIEKEVNKGKNFLSLRQIYNSMILSTWFKRNLKESLLGKVYVEKNKVSGVDIEDKQVREKIYQQYLEAFKVGVYDYIKEDYDPATQEIIQRKYFSGGMEFRGEMVGEALLVEPKTRVETLAKAEETTDGSLKTVSAYLETVRNLEKEIRLIRRAARKNPEIFGEITNETSIGQMMDALIVWLQKEGLIVNRDEIDGNELIIVSDEAKKFELGRLLSEGGLNNMGVIKGAAGVKMNNYRRPNGEYRIIGFESESTQKQIGKEVAEIKKRREGKHQLEAFVLAAQESGGDVVEDYESLQEDDEKWEAGRQDEIAASSGVQTDPASFNEESSVALEKYISYRKIFRAEPTEASDVKGVVTQPGRFKEVVEGNSSDLEPAKIDFLITRQAPLKQSILELVSNASDAITGRSAPIGRFGVGAMQMLAFVLDENNPALSQGAHIVVNTRTAEGNGRQVTFFKGTDGKIKFNIEEGDKRTAGTTINIRFPQRIDPKIRTMLEQFLEGRLNLFTKMRVNLNGRLVNPLDDHIFLNGDKVRYDHPDKNINVTITNEEIVVEDMGSGMNDDVLLNKYLIPRLGENQNARKPQTDEDITRDVHLFYKGPQRSDEETTTRVVFQVAGINIQSTEIEGYGLPRELIIQLPSSTKLTVSRDRIEIDESTHMAIRAMARKIVEGNPIHQVNLINGFMQAVKLLDELNTRVEALQPLVDTAKEKFIPFVMRQQGLILPNDKLFRQLDVPEDTLFLDPDITYKISPEQIPGSEDITHAFREGRLKKAFVVPFKKGSKVTYLEAGPYLLLNKRMYEKYRDYPLFLNLRLNFYVGSGRIAPPKGWILSAREIEEKRQRETPILPLLEEFSPLKNALSESQTEWLQAYMQDKAQEAQPVQEKQTLPKATEQLGGIDLTPSEDMFGGLVGLLSTPPPDNIDKATLSGGDGAMIGRTPQPRRRRMQTDPNVDASAERLREVFQRLNEFVASVPEHMRDQIKWEEILPMQGNNARDFEQLLVNPNQMLLPDTEFMVLHSAYFLNQDHPERVRRYLKNLLIANHLTNGKDQTTIHKIISQLDARGLDKVDGEMIAYIAEAFKNRNLENLEEAFQGINKALPHVTDEGIKRVIMRWLRIYKNDPRAANMFHESLSRSYDREMGEETTVKKRVKVPSAHLGIYNGYNAEVPTPTAIEFTGLKVEGKLVVTSFHENRIHLFTVDSSTGETRPLTKFFESSASEINSITFTGKYADDLPIFVITSDATPFHSLFYTINLETGEREYLNANVNTEGIRPLADENFENYKIKQTNLKGPNGENLLLLTIQGKKTDLITTHLMYFDTSSNTLQSFMDLSDAILYGNWATAPISIVTETENPLLIINAGSSSFYTIDLNSKRVTPVKALWPHFYIFDEKTYHSVQVIQSDGEDNLVLAAIEEETPLYRNSGKLSLFNLNTNTRKITPLDHKLEPALKGDAIGIQVLEVSDNPVIAVMTTSKTLFESTKDNMVHVLKVDLKNGVAENIQTYGEKEFGESNSPSAVYYDPESQLLVVPTEERSSRMIRLKAIEGLKVEDEKEAEEPETKDAKDDDGPRPVFIFDFRPGQDDHQNLQEGGAITSLQRIRTGFQALQEGDDLGGIPPMVRTIARFLKEEDVTLIKEEKPDDRSKDWETTDQLDAPVSLALLNYLYERMAKEIKGNPNITFQELLAMIEQFRGKDLRDYVNIIRSAIEGQDKTQRAWVREIAVQNARDATRRAREEGELEAEAGEIHIRNFTDGEDWVFSVRDHGSGMSLWHLIRYFFPLDQSSKDYLHDTGNLGQGNYTLFADFDRVFIRTSNGDGTINEIEIVRDEENGPVIKRWDVLQGDFKGTEIRRVKKKEKSDPQLESLFIQEALERFGGAIQSPEAKRKKGLEPGVRDVKVLYNREPFSEDVDVVESSDLGASWGEVSLGRAKKKYQKRVVQDGIFIKSPDEKELKFIPQWLQIAFERFGGLHINLPRSILLNIPRTGYSKEHKFLHRLQVAVLHNTMKTILKDYTERGAKIPGISTDYFDNPSVRDKEGAQRIVALMYEGRYEEITEKMLSPFLKSPNDFFELLTHLPFTSETYDGEMTMHEIRERFMEQSRIRERRTAAVGAVRETRFNEGFTPRGEFAEDIRESVGSLAALLGGAISGRMGTLIENHQRAEETTPEEVWERLPEGAKTKFEYLIMRLIKPIVGNDMPEFAYYFKADGGEYGSTRKERISWNLAEVERMMRMLMEPQGEERLTAELQSGKHGDEFWEFIDTLAHESQHLPKFEEPGDHTHQAEETIEGYEEKEDTRFGVRMGRALDEILSDLDDDVVGEFFRPQTEMADFVRENRRTASSPEEETDGDETDSFKGSRADAVDEALTELEKKSQLQAQESRTDSVQLGQKEKVGGINLNPNLLELQTQGQGIDFSILIDPQAIQRIQIDGFSPVIFQIVPTNLPMLMGLVK